ncbi:MAG: L-serine ammonia-lyase, iron-sulfur-dependent, subunit alpha [Eubacterium sp.]
MNFTTGSMLLKICKRHNLSISEVMRTREIKYLEKNPEEVEIRMKHAYSIMKNAVTEALNEELISMGGLIGGEAKELNAKRLAGKNVCGTLISKAIAYAMGVLEVNASMGLIVAAPTAGSSGVIPGVFIAIQEEYGFSDDQMESALFNAGAIGYIISRNATVSGAEGGCQAEIGSASAMAASAVTEILGGTPQMCLGAASNALSNLLGLVCDPIAGLVEVPCQKRNAMGASNAIVSAEIALAGVPNLIPFDEVVSAMFQVGKHLPPELRETALGGMAATPTGCALCHKIYKKD